PRELVSPDTIRSWRADMLAALVGPREVLAGVAVSQRDPAWLRAHRALERIVDYLNSIEVEGFEAAERAWMLGLAFEPAASMRGASKGWKRDFMSRLKIVGQVASTITPLIPLVIAIPGADSVADCLPQIFPPAEIKLLRSGH